MKAGNIQEATGLRLEDGHLQEKDITAEAIVTHLGNNFLIQIIKFIRKHEIYNE